LLLLFAAAPAAAQTQDSQTAPAQPPDALTVRLTLRPAAAPIPALKYPLLPEVRDLKPGNAVLLYYRAFAPEWSSTFRLPEVNKVIDKWTEDMSRVPPPELRWVRTSAALKEVDRGARRAYCDWDMYRRLREEGIGLLLPDVQSFRMYMNFLAARARLEMADGDLGQAVYTLQTGLKLGHDVGAAPTLIQSLVGMAITTVMLSEVEELIQTPGSPNLYWSLTQLPTPFIDLRQPLGAERLMLDSFFPELQLMRTTAKIRVMSPGEVQVMVDRLARQLQGLGLTPQNYGFEARVGLAAMAAEVYPRARSFLRKQGLSEKEAEAMPVLQAAFLYELYNYDRLYDDFRKWAPLPYWQARRGMNEAEIALKRNKAAGPSTGTTLAALLLPAIRKVQFATARTDRRIAALRCVEAVRLHAAAHGGKLPARLDDIREVPVPVDPVSGRAFEYTAQGDRAVLYAPPPPGEAGAEHNALRYELTLQHQAPGEKR
jgi:hypothetical protein